MYGGSQVTFRMFSRHLLIGAAIIVLCGISVGCSFSSSSNKDKVTIYTSIEDYRIEYLNKELEQKFPNYDINIKFFSTGDHIAKLLKEGTKTDCDITHSLSYSYLQQLDDEGYLANLSSYDRNIYAKGMIVSRDFLPQERGSGAIIINTDMLKELNLKTPSSYKDLLKSEYRGLVVMPNPKESSTGYMFYKSLVNAWGEKKALAYFDKLTDNILQYTESGSGPLEAVAKGKAAVGLGTTATAAEEINKGMPIKILYFKEGAPFTVYGQAMIKGKEKRKAVRDVFDYLVHTFNYENCKLYMPETIYKNKSFSIKNYPHNIKYADMSNDTIAEKNMLLSKWKY